MLDMERSRPGDSRLLASQLIIAAMVLGIVVFYLFVYVKPIETSSTPEQAHMFSLFGFAFTVAALCASFIIHFVVAARGVRGIIRRVQAAAGEAGKDDEAASREIYARLASLHLLRVIMCGAMLEGTAFFLGIAYLLHRKPLELIVGIFVTLIIACMFPTRDRFERWVERQKRIIQDETFGM